MKAPCSYLSFLLFLTSLNVYSGENNSTEVFFSVSRTAACRSIAPVDAETIDIGAIDRNRTASLADLLEGTAPLNVRRLNGPGGLATVSMRGFQAKQTAVFMDDIRVPADITGTVDLSVIPAAGLGKVEILPGATASVYGANAEGGVLHLFTRRLLPGARLAEAGADHSSFNTRNYSMKAGAAGKVIETFFAGASGSSDGFQRNSELNKDSANGRVSADLGAAGKLTVTGLFSRLKTELPSGTPVPISEWNGSKEKQANSLTDWQTSTRGMLSGSWSGGPENFSFRADSSRSVNNIKAFQSGADSATRVIDRSVSARATLFKTSVLGAESAASSLDSKTYNDHVINSAGFFAQTKFSPAGGIELTPGARLDRSGVYKSRISPKLAAVYAPDEKWKFSASAGAGFQPPTFADLYNPWAPPAPGLKPETSMNSEAGVYYGDPSGWYAGVSGYYSAIKHRIALDPLTWAAANLASGFNSGLEAQTGYKTKNFSVSGGYVRNISMVKSAGATHELMNFSPRHRVTGTVAATVGGFELGLTGRGVSKQYTGRGKTGLRLPEYWVSGFTVSKDLGLIELWGGVSNILDRHYAETADTFNGWFPQPGRTFSAGLKTRFL